ncbi:MAG: hypothetical protein CMH49_03950, partial [Myxococcales bacterium]|nr:hypothetical protein [Myxococcales bacterium]
MTTPNAYPKAMLAMTRWAKALVPEDEPTQWLSALSEVYLIWNECYSSAARQSIHESISTLSGDSFKPTLQKIVQTVALEAARSVRSLTITLRKVKERSEVFEAINLMLQDAGYAELERPRLNKYQRRLGRHIIHRLIGLKEGKDGKNLPWLKDDGTEGIAALALVTDPLNDLEKISYAKILLDGISQLHSERLEPGEGFAPEKILLNYDFQIVVPRLPATAIPKLFSPERKISQKISPPGDVWALGRILVALFTGQSLNQKPIIGDTVPTDLKRVLERCLHSDDQERLYSAREVKVVINGPFKAWEDRLEYEEDQTQSETETEALPYEELAAEREQAQEERVRNRRFKEVRLRQALMWRASRQQTIIITLVALVLGVGYYFYASKVAKQQAAYDAKVAQIKKLSEQLDLELSEYQKDVPKVLKKAGFKWRLLTASQDFPPFLISATEVTYEQYKQCVKADKCKRIKMHEGCVWGAEGHETDPMNCLDFHQARSFAHFMGGELPYVEQWMWAATYDGGNRYPWGKSKITKKHANLNFDSYGWETVLQPVCSFRLGDSNEGVCDLVGSLAEWVIISETGEPGAYYELRAGVMGGSLLTSPEFVSLNRPERVNSKTSRFDIGFRVVKSLGEIKVEEAKAEDTKEAKAEDTKEAKAEDTK